MVWFEPSEKFLIAPAAKEKTQIHFQGKDTDSFSSSNAFKNNDALWTLSNYKVIHTEVGDLFSEKKRYYQLE